MPIEENGAIKRHVRHEIARQHIAVLRALLPMVRARRAALRSAVSAIMGRNMSHNIGSHVLARYAFKAGRDISKTISGKADHRSDFLSYLQRRMDFLAEVATSDQSFWSQPLSLRDEVKRLNYGEQMKRFSDPNPCLIDRDCDHYLSPKQTTQTTPAPPDGSHPILLSWITGKESLLASVEYGLPELECCPNETAPPVGCCLGYKASPPKSDPLFACPGGEVGAHALFIILENVIRNSARHGGGSMDTVRVFVHVDDSASNDESIAIELIDPRTSLNKDGILSGQEKGGKQAKSLPHDINRILREEPFLDDAGAPNPRYWGVREMQICAHFLRGYKFSDLEGVPPSGGPILEAAVHPLGGDKWCLKYRFYLQRAKLLVAVLENADSYRELSNQLRRNGVVVRGKPSEEDGWQEISKAGRGYGFMVVEDTIDLPKDGTPERVALPVRTFHMANYEINELITTASQDATLTWMDKLHELLGMQYKEKREFSWRGKTLYGVVFARGVLAARLQNTTLPTAPQQGGCLFWVDASNIRPNNPIRPLPRSLGTWFNEGKIIAAAWLDHGGEDEFDNGACLGAAAQCLQEAMPGRIWISAEGAFNDSLHTACLHELNGATGHELLAAALPRVVVLDERVQSERDREARSKLPLGRMWPLMGVWVPPHINDGEKPYTSLSRCDLDTPKFQAIKEFLERPARREDQYPVDFLVIHLTILERLKEEIGESLPVTLKLLKDGTPADGAQVTIVTGRGVPSMARRLRDDEHLDTARFLPISALLESLVLRPSKVALMRVLWSAGRPGDSGNS